jgi:hypothetical protein
MLVSIRKGVFETNSSSTHSLTMCSAGDYEEWKEGKLFYNDWNENFITKDEVYKDLEITEDMSEDVVDDIINDSKYYTYDRFFDEEYLETFVDRYTTKSKEEVVAFGKYGMDN